MCWALPLHAGDLAVAAASSFVHTLPELAQAFERQSGHRVRVSYGASGNLARQILQGAPFDVFLSADERSARHVLPRADGPGRVFALGRLVVYANDPHVVADLAGFAAACRDGRIRRLAIANPDHAPYGIAAREVLDGLGLTTPGRPQLVYGENVAQAAQFAATGAVDAGLLALALVSSERFPDRGGHFPVPATAHAPIRQSLVVLRGAGPTARQFAQFIAGPAAAGILAAHGFEPVPQP